MINIPPIPPSGTFGAFKPQVPEKKSFSPYIIFLVLILVLGAAYYYFVYIGINFSIESQNPPLAPALTDLENKIVSMPDFNFSVFDSSFYKSLKMYGAIPIVVDSLGRTNPFIPY